MRLLRTVCWQLVRTGLTVWAMASVIFLLSYRDAQTAVELAMPQQMDGRASTIGTGTGAGVQAARQATRERLGLALPLFYVSRWQWHGSQNQYHQWVWRLSCGDLGTSFRTGQPVRGQLCAALGLAQRLAARPWWHRPVRAMLVGLHTLPLFVVALGLLLLFANPAALAWFPAYGFNPGGDPAAGPLSQGLDYARHLALPVAALVLSALPELTLQLEGALQAELAQGYATTARAKGLAPAAVIRRHALRNALLPTITQLAQLLPALVAGAVVVEVVFALPGMGRLLATAAAARDYPVLIGGVLLTGLSRLVAQLLADLFYLWADPRIRWQS